MSETKPTETPPQIAIEASVAADINLALAQNAVPIIRDLALVNPPGLPERSGLTLTIEPEPAFCEPITITIDRLSEDVRLSIDQAEPRLALAYLRGLAEAVPGHLTFRLTDAAGLLLAESIKEVRLLARDEWGGTGSLPELIAAFVQPNDAAVGPLLRDVVEALRVSGVRDQLDAYDNRSPKQVAQLIAAVWQVVCALRLGYAVPPASFEKRGQKGALAVTGAHRTNRGMS